MIPDPVDQRLKQFQSQLQQNPENWRLWKDYGDFLDEEYIGVEHKILQAYQKVAQLNPKADFRVVLGRACVRVGEIEKGLGMIQQSIDDNPRVDAYCILADVLMCSLDRYAEARAACEKAIECEPDFEEAWYLLGEATKDESRYEAILHYRYAIELDPNYQLAWQALGRELLFDREFVESIDALKKAIELDPEDGWAMIFLANALAKTGQFDEADRWYQAAIKAFPDYDQFKEWYSEFLRQQGKQVE